MIRTVYFAPGKEPVIREFESWEAIQAAVGEKDGRKAMLEPVRNAFGRNLDFLVDEEGLMFQREIHTHPLMKAHGHPIAGPVVITKVLRNKELTLELAQEVLSMLKAG